MSDAALLTSRGQEMKELAALGIECGGGSGASCCHGRPRIIGVARACSLVAGLAVGGGGCVQGCGSVWWLCDSACLRGLCVCRVCESACRIGDSWITPRLRLRARGASRE